MQFDRTPCFTPVDHPDARVQRIGFDLTDPYVEQCWSVIVGPSATLVFVVASPRCGSPEYAPRSAAADDSVER